MEKALRESESRWQFALEGSGDGTCGTGISRPVKSFIPAGLKECWESRNTNLPQGSGKNPSTRKTGSATGALKAHLEGRSPVYISEHRLLCKDGTRPSGYWPEEAILSRAEDGEPLRMAGTLSDISERKAAEQALRESQEEYRLFVETASEGIWAADVENRVTFVNWARATCSATKERKSSAGPISAFISETNLEDHWLRMRNRECASARSTSASSREKR